MNELHGHNFLNIFLGKIGGAEGGGSEGGSAEGGGAKGGGAEGHQAGGGQEPSQRLPRNIAFL